MPWPQLTLVAGNHSSIALGGKDGVKVRPGVAVDLLLVGDDGVELGGVELVSGACGGGGGGAYEGGGSRPGKGSRQRVSAGCESTRVREGVVARARQVVTEPGPAMPPR